MQTILSSLHLYPVKSCAPLAVDAASVEARGLAHDRRWMVVDEHGRFLTGRELPRLTLLRAVPRDDGALQLDAPGMPAFTLVPPHAHGHAGSTRALARASVTVWRSTVDAVLAEAQANAWLGEFLQRPARFVFMDDTARRGVSPDYGRAGDEVSFADGYPLLLISQAALDQLNEKLARPVPMLRFRPNLVVAGTTPHAEDDWKRVRIGAVEFDVVKPCARCVFTTVDFTRGEKDPGGEPLRTLATYRRSPGGVTFGQNLIPRGTGTLRVGDAVRVVA